MNFHEVAGSFISFTWKTNQWGRELHQHFAIYIKISGMISVE